MSEPRKYTFEEFVAMNPMSDEERYEECLECNGEGDHECSCGHIHKCETCHGQRHIDHAYEMYVALLGEQTRKWEEWHKLAVTVQ